MNTRFHDFVRLHLLGESATHPLAAAANGHRHRGRRPRPARPSACAAPGVSPAALNTSPMRLPCGWTRWPLIQRCSFTAVIVGMALKPRGQRDAKDFSLAPAGGRRDLPPRPLPCGLVHACMSPGYAGHGSVPATWNSASGKSCISRPRAGRKRTRSPVSSHSQASCEMGSFLAKALGVNSAMLMPSS